MSAMRSRAGKDAKKTLTGLTGGKAPAKPKAPPPAQEGEGLREMKYTVLLYPDEARLLEDEVFRRRASKLKSANKSAVIREAIAVYLK